MIRLALPLVNWMLCILFKQLKIFPARSITFKDIHIKNKLVVTDPQR